MKIPQGPGGFCQIIRRIQLWLGGLHTKDTALAKLLGNEEELDD